MGPWALFSDGSSDYRDRSGGWAYCVIDCFGTEIIGTGAIDDTTNNRMEMMAIIEGLNFLYNQDGPCDVLLYSDSEYVGLGLMDRSRSRKKNTDLWYLIDAAVDNHLSVEYIHVKGHKDSHYNCLVDELAGQSRKERKEFVSSRP